MQQRGIFVSKNGDVKEIVEDIPELEPGPPPPPSLDDRVKTLETETAAISAAIERGLSL